MTEKQQTELMDQIKAIYKSWACYSMNNDRTIRLINGLFNMAKEIDPKGMRDAFVKGAAGLS